MAKRLATTAMGALAPSMNGPIKPSRRTLHPALKAHGAKVKAAHAALSRTPAYKSAHPLARMSMLQAHIRRNGR